MALPIGLLMGDVPQAMMIGAAIELVYVGIISPGANVPADECLAGVIAIPIAMKIGADPATAVVLAVPFGVLGVFLDQLRRTVNARWAHVADKYALAGDEKGLFRCAVIYPMAVGFLMRFPPVFIANYFGADVVEKFLNAMPQWIIHGISVTGGVLPCPWFCDHFVRHRAEIPASVLLHGILCSSVFKDQHDGSRGFWNLYCAGYFIYEERRTGRDHAAGEETSDL